MGESINCLIFILYLDCVIILLDNKLTSLVVIWDFRLVWLSFVRSPDNVHNFISITPISSSSPMFDNLLESSHRGNSKKWSNIAFVEEIPQVELIDVEFTNLWLDLILILFFICCGCPSWGRQQAASTFNTSHKECDVKVLRDRLS